MPAEAAAPRLSIVVLPFLNLGGGPEQDDFVDGITESLTSDLSRIAGAFVIARNTAFTYKRKAVDVKQIGRNLNVRYVLEGSVQRGGARMRVSVQLIDAGTGGHLWSERFDKPVADLFDMQDEVVSRLANRLGQELAVAEARRLRSPRTPIPSITTFLGSVSITATLSNFCIRPASISTARLNSIRTMSRPWCAGPGSRCRLSRHGFPKTVSNG